MGTEPEVNEILNGQRTREFLVVFLSLHRFCLIPRTRQTY